MLPDQTSSTALATSLIRAVHARVDPAPLVADPYGDRLVAAEERAQWYGRFVAMLGPDDRARVGAIAAPDDALTAATRLCPAYGAVVVRQRWAEDLLDAARRRGVRQYVIVGAGLDTWALRHPELAEEVRVFEVDHPASQTSKRQRFDQAGLAVPPNVRLVAADLERRSLRDALAATDFEPTAPAFVTALGITQYLSRSANLALFESLAAAAPDGSALAFDYLEERALVPSAATGSMQRVSAERAASDEPWVSGFLPERLAGDLTACGLELLDDLGPEATEARYCRGRPGDLSVAPHVHLAVARIRPRAR